VRIFWPGPLWMATIGDPIALHPVLSLRPIALNRFAIVDDCSSETPCYHFAVIMTDTTPSARALQWRVQRAMTGEERLLMALEMSVFVRELQKARIHQEHPEWPRYRDRARTSPINISTAVGTSAAPMNVAKVFLRITAMLDQAGIPYMLTGSFASAYYGVPRSSQHIDLIIEASPAQLQTFIKLLPSDEYYADLEMAWKPGKVNLCLT